MDFMEVFETEKPKIIFEESCKRAKPGRDKITYKKFEGSFDDNISIIRHSILKEKYKFTKYEVFLKVKKHYQLPRLIFKTTIRDRLVIKLVTDYLYNFYTDKGFNTVKTRDYTLDLLTEAVRRQNKGNYKYNYYLRLDISSYFDSIDRELLFKLLREDGIDKKVLYLLGKMLYTMDLSLDRPNYKGIPQGLSVCSILAERYLKDIDDKYNEKYLRDSLIFIRYVDDVLIFTDSNVTIRKIKTRILNDLLTEYSLQINENKISEGSLNDTDFEFLGVKISERHVSISDLQYRKITSQLLELFRWYKKHIINGGVNLKSATPNRLVKTLTEKLNLLITGYMSFNKVKGKRVRYGWILTSLPRQIDDTTKLKDLDKYVMNMINNYVFDKTAKEFIVENKKSFYHAFVKARIEINGGYFIDREVVSKDVNEMYRITCNLSMVDLKYNNLNYDKYDETLFENETGDNLFNYFCRSLYVSNRDVCADILYW